ncbi:MAG: hypothetical protein IKX97_02555 [Erysipelotrichaceae bacterium]|nr:hypothetical protein [Erysipelotrichaceae bacterium]
MITGIIGLIFGIIWGILGLVFGLITGILGLVFVVCGIVGAIAIVYILLKVIFKYDEF